MEYNSHIPGEPFMWLAEYNDGTSLAEFDKDNVVDRHVAKNEVDFTKLEKFGLMGNGYYFHYDTTTGVFDVNGRKISVEFEGEDGEKIQFMNLPKGKYHDLIVFRKVENVLINNQSYYAYVHFGFGYKHKAEKYNFKFIFYIDRKGQLFFTYWIVMDDAKNGVLKLMAEGTPIGALKAEFEANVGKEFKWFVVKHEEEQTEQTEKKE